MEYECGEYVFQADRLPSFFSFCILTKANISETGMIASVRVSFTMVEYSNTAPFVPCSVSQVEAAAVTEEVSLTAVPAKSPKPVSVSPSTFPSVGKISAAITLKRKITDMAWAICSSSASMTGAAAAMAEPPQMQEPTPIRAAVLPGIR